MKRKKKAFNIFSVLKLLLCFVFQVNLKLSSKVSIVANSYETNNTITKQTFELTIQLLNN